MRVEHADVVTRLEQVGLPLGREDNSCLCVDSLEQSREKQNRPNHDYTYLQSLQNQSTENMSLGEPLRGRHEQGYGLGADEGARTSERRPSVRRPLEAAS